MTPPQNPVDMHHRLSKHLGISLILLVLAYFISGKLGLALSLVADNVTLIWPPTGLAVASLLLFGPRLWPGVFVGALLLNLTTSAPLETAILIAFGNTGEALAAYWLLMRWAPINPSLPRLRDVLRLIVLGGGVATLVSATVGVASLLMGGVINMAMAPTAWLFWWMGDAMGAIVFGPMILAWMSNRTYGYARSWSVEEIGFTLAVIVVAWVSLSGLGPFSHKPPFPLAFTVFPLLIWGAARFGLRGAAYCILVFTLMALLGVLTGAGLFKRADIVESFTLLWLYANILAISGLTLAAFVREITDAQSGLRLAANVFEHMPTGILIADAQGKVLTANPACLHSLDLTSSELTGKNIRALMMSQDGDTTDIVNKVSHDGIWDGEVWYRRPGGQVLPTLTTIAQAQDHQGRSTHLIAAITDISDRKQIEARNRELAEHDMLTSLPNRTLLTDRLNQAMRYAARHKSNVGVLFVDLDRFKVINDSLGHDVGDLLLVEVANRLKACVRSEDTVARQGGDEFVLVINDIQHDHELALVAKKVLDAVSGTFPVRDYVLDITASIGIAVFPRDGDVVSDLLKHADLAMYHGKESGASYHFYGEDMDRRAQARLRIEGELRRALEKGEFLLHYQPQVDTQSGAIVGIEALLRWQTPDGKMIPPNQFIDIAEETGLILPIGSWVLREAVTQIARWQAKGLTVPRVAINVSSKQIWCGDFDAEINAVLSASHIAPQQLEIEVTESVFLRASDDVAATMDRLHALGISIAIDDFGTGYSSLGYLRRLKVHTLKLDRAFVMDLPHSSEAGAIASAVISLAQGLGLAVVAEGVETREQYAYLQKLKCHQVQGFYFSKPVSAEDCIRLLKMEKFVSKSVAEA